MPAPPYLPSYARYLRKGRVDELVRAHLRLVRELEMPIVRRLLALPEAELFELARRPLVELLDLLAEGKWGRDETDPVRSHVSDQVASVPQDAFTLNDFVVGFSARKRALLAFIPDFTADPRAIMALVDEIETLCTFRLSIAIGEFTKSRDELIERSARLSIDQHQFEALARGVTDQAVFLVDLSGRILTWNVGAERLFGFGKEQVVGRDMAMFHLTEDRCVGLPQHLLHVASERDEAEDEGWRLRRNGTSFWAETMITAVKDDQGAVTGFAKFTRDMNERKRTEEVLAERNRELARANQELQEADRYKDEFLSVISHELRTPLNFITGFGSILQDGIAGPLNDQQMAYLDRIMNGADRMLGLVDNLLDLSRMAAGRFHLAPGWVPFAPMLDEAILPLHALADRRNVTLTADCGVADPVWMDGPRIIQVITNLVDNAMKFTEAGGQVTVRAAIQDGSVLTEVEDTGIGIPDDDLDKVFQRFRQLDMGTTRRVGGAGLGLAIAKELVEAHGGRIGLRSTIGKGTTFWFSLPLVQSDES
jgi:hypothetical protein